MAIQEFATVVANSPSTAIYVNAAEYIYHSEAICEYYGVDHRKHAAGLDRQLAAAYYTMFRRNPRKCGAKIGHMSCNFNAYTLTDIYLLAGVITRYIYTH